MSIPTLRSLEHAAIKSAGVQRARAYAPSGPVCVATQGFVWAAALNLYNNNKLVQLSP